MTKIKLKVLLDTNIIISYLTKSGLEQYNLAKTYLLKLKSGIVKILLPSIIIAEIVYIIIDYYQFEKENVVDFLVGLISEEDVELEDKEVVLSALEKFENNNLDFADCYLWALLEFSKAELITFDKKLNKLASI